MVLKATVLLPFLVFGVAASAIAQPPEPQSSAAALLGVQERTVQDTSLPTPETVTLPAVRDPFANVKGPLGNLEILSGGIQRRANPSDVFPKPSYEYDSGMKIRYRLDQ